MHLHDQAFALRPLLWSSHYWIHDQGWVHVAAGHSLSTSRAQSHAEYGCLQVLDINTADTCLTLTSGGCNALNLIVQGAGKVHSVDCNPAQSSLLELKATAIRCAPSSCVARSSVTLDGVWHVSCLGVCHRTAETAVVVAASM